MMRLWRQRKPRVLLVPNHWSGSVQEYYHFLLGYLGPVMVWVSHNPGKQIAVRDCGPMNVWIDTFLDDVDVEVLNPGAMLHLFAGKVHRSKVLKGFDNPEFFNTRNLHEFRNLILARVHKEEDKDKVSLRDDEVSGQITRITVIDRASSGEFNATSAAEVPASGAAVRSIPNLRSALRNIGFADRVSIVDAAHIEPMDQVRLFEHTSVLVGQHGAGLANMLWMRPGSTVIEILPPSPPWVEPIFTKLAQTLGHRIIVIRQDGPHAPVDADSLAQALSAATAEAP